MGGKEAGGGPRGLASKREIWVKSQKFLEIEE